MTPGAHGKGGDGSELPLLRHGASARSWPEAGSDISSAGSTVGEPPVEASAGRTRYPGRREHQSRGNRSGWIPISFGESSLPWPSSAYSGSGFIGAAMPTPAPRSSRRRAFGAVGERDPFVSANAGLRVPRTKRPDVVCHRGSDRRVTAGCKRRSPSIHGQECVRIARPRKAGFNGKPRP
jgi:hypothetical protein